MNERTKESEHFQRVFGVYGKMNTSQLYVWNKINAALMVKDSLGRKPATLADFARDVFKHTTKGDR